MKRSKTIIACLLAVLVAESAGQRAPATAPASSGTSATSPLAAEAPFAFAPTSGSTASTPNPSATTRERSSGYASDGLATTKTSYNQIQTVGTYASAHVAPPVPIQTYLSGAAAGRALPADAYSPNSTLFDQPQLFDQLESAGARQLHFKIYYDPKGTQYQLNSGLKIANVSANLTATNEKWSYPGWKVMSEPNFDFNTTCVGLSTCLLSVKNWILSTPSPAPITIYLEPSAYTYTAATGSNTTFAAALAASNQTGGPDTLAQPLDIITYEPFYQPWRDLENELLMAFNNNEFFSIVTPDDLIADEPDLATAVFKQGYTLYPALEDLKTRILFVLSGEYVYNYLEYREDLVNATLFISEPYNELNNYTTSTIFVDVVGPLDGVNATSFNVTAANTAVAAQAAAVTDAVKAGYIVRASADWETIEPRNNYTNRYLSVLRAGAHFVQTSFPTSPTYFPSTYSVALPIRENVKQSTRCNPVTSGGLFNSTLTYTVGCPAVNALTPAVAPAASSA